jgi:hypothetical protein
MNSAKAFAIFFCKFLVVYTGLTTTGELNSHHQQSPMRVEAYVRRGALKGSFAILLSPLQCQETFGTMTYALASADQSPVFRPRT